MRCKYMERTLNNPDLVRFQLKVSDPATRLKCEICATRVSHSLNLLSTKARLKEIFSSCVDITSATDACGLRAIL